MADQLSIEFIAHSAIADLKSAQRQLERAHVQNATLSAENRRLRRMTTNGKQGRLLHRAAADARQLVGWRAAGYSVTRRNAESYGMSRRRWVWAVGLLRVARVLDARTATADEFLVDDTTDCLAAIDRAVKICEERGLESLILRLPKNHAKWPKRAR